MSIEAQAVREIKATMKAAIIPPDRRSTVQWAEDVGFALPGSLRSQRFRIEIAPWLRLPLTLSDNPRVRRLMCMAAVQASKSTAGEIIIGRKLATDPGNMLYNWEDEGKAKELWDDRIERTIRQAKQLAHRMPPQKTKQRELEIQFRDGYYFRIQGVRAEKSRQSKSVRYLINEEVKDWVPGALTDLRNRVTAAWNSLEVNITPASMDGDEVHTLWKESSQFVYHVECPTCRAKQIPRFRTKPGERGGLHICDPSKDDELDRVKKAEHEYDYAEIARLLYYECESCGHRWKDTPIERNQFVGNGIDNYVSLNPTAPETDRACSWNALIVPWIPWVGLIKEFHNALRAMRYGDLSLYKNFVQKREVAFFKDDLDDMPRESTVEITVGAKKNREGMPDKQFRFMMCDKQRGSARKGEAPHYWVIIRDWKPGRSTLIFEGRVNTDEELEALRLDYGIDPVFCAVDTGDGATTIEAYKMCARFGYTALKGEDKSGYQHIIGGQKTTRRFSPDQQAFATAEGGAQIPITLILYSKQGIRDALHFLRTSADFKWEVPEDVGADYKKHMESEELVDWHIPKTGQRVKIWRQVARRNDLFVCECYQALYADIAGIIGMAPIENRPDGIRSEHNDRG